MQKAPKAHATSNTCRYVWSERDVGANSVKVPRGCNVNSKVCTNKKKAAPKSLDFENIRVGPLNSCRRCLWTRRSRWVPHRPWRPSGNYRDNPGNSVGNSMGNTNGHSANYMGNSGMGNSLGNSGNSMDNTHSGNSMGNYGNSGKYMGNSGNSRGLHRWWRRWRRRWRRRRSYPPRPWRWRWRYSKVVNADVEIHPSTQRVFASLQ